MSKVLEVIGWRRGANSVDLFRTWHTYAVMAIAFMVAAALAHLL